MDDKQGFIQLILVNYLLYQSLFRLPNALQLVVSFLSCQFPLHEEVILKTSNTKNRQIFIFNFKNLQTEKI